MTGRAVSAFPDTQMDEVAHKIQDLLKEQGLGGAIIVVSPLHAGLMVVEPEGWYRRDCAEITPDETLKYSHWMTCMHKITATMHNSYHAELERLLQDEFMPSKNLGIWH